MNGYETEVDENFRRFSSRIPLEQQEVQAELSAFVEKYAQSYRRLTTLSAWWAAVIERGCSDAAQFFAEARNDAISSHVFARMGAWRASLKFLRSVIENVLNCLYYCQHPVELQQWATGSHRLTFTELVAYMRAHPALIEFTDSEIGIARLKAEYSTLSLAVHGSSESFRMTDSDGGTKIWSSDRARLGGWLTRERHVLGAINLLLAAFFREELHGARHPGLRESLKFVFPTVRMRQVLEARFGITIPV